MKLSLSLKSMQAPWNNPVIVRDMRVKLRGSRAFWNQAFYLGILTLISVFGYVSATNFGSHGIDPVAIQSALQGFYYSIFMTLAGLVCLIAPALTAVAIVSERQRLTLDLLVTTPMTSIQMLSGKLFSSLAFLGLLLVLSAPESALCVILGGATVADIAQTYLVLMIDGLFFAAIGLAISCISRNSSQAILLTYGAVIGFLTVTTMFGAATAAIIPGGPRTMPLGAALSQLNPFLAAAPHGSMVQCFGLELPVWLVTGILAAILIRLILTGAALRLGLYGPGLVVSLRRQALFATLLLSFMLGSYGSFPMGSGRQDPLMWISITGLALFVCSLFFLPALFVPAANEDTPIGEAITGWYSPKEAFSGNHSGALPYFHLWLFMLVAGIVLRRFTDTLASAAIPGPNAFGDLGSVALATYFFLSGLGFVLWSLARRAAWITPTFTTARPLTFIMFLFVMIAPAAVMLTESTMTSGWDPFSDSAWRYAWILYPYTTFSGSGHAGVLSLFAFAGYGVLAYVLGALIYPFWSRVTPGAGSRKAAKKSRAPVEAA